MWLQLKGVKETTHKAELCPAASMAERQNGQTEPTMTDFAGLVLADLSSFAARALKDANQTLSAWEAVTSPYTCLLRPWREFLDLELPDLDAEPDVLQRMVRNIAHFQANYLTVGSLLFCITIYQHTSWLLAVLLLFGVWAYYISRGGLDTEWKPMVFGIEATASHRLALMYASSMALIFLVFGQFVLVLLGILGTLTMAHALCNATLVRKPIPTPTDPRSPAVSRQREEASPNKTSAIV